MAWRLPGLPRACQVAGALQQAVAPGRACVRPGGLRAGGCWLCGCLVRARCLHRYRNPGLFVGRVEGGLVDAIAQCLRAPLSLHRLAAVQACA